ncbi:MAG: phenylalanine--tRNA ligase subunit beta [Bacteroides sp.]|nr:phenylalanine--tRNA ligase subunit beta [Roseburia sp.]MCM1347048.1 phenylalanine--tRNA ligase subunit beta [Bacteroides sp.]MCM1421730.1 phenylalanine--tRNA ligase subunit beta [Bacteroides sp.]
MNVSYKWLKEYVDFDMSPMEVADALTSIGLEVGAVEEVQSIKGGLEGLVVGKVLTCEAHPNSDHMHVCTVDLGDRTEQIVCGAANVAAGEKVIVATLGTKLYDGDQCFTIKKSKLRGIESNGMICAEDEIGIGNDHNGIIVLPEDTEVGMPAAKYYGLESDWLIEVDITPNHSDACSHWGVARDFYAYLKQNGYTTELHRPSCDAFSVDSHALDIDVVVEQTEACPRYCAVTVKNCEVKESPKWLKDKLTTIGLRPINNIVDITNYIMMAYGQPLHCFDADMIKGGKVVVKAMPEGTPFVTLDGVEHKLSEKDLAICNAEEPMCIAGVFGGKGSGTYETTKDVLFESAYFHPTWIRKSARRHGLQTDASFRFERGIDPDGQIYALKQAAILAKELAGGEIAMEIKDVVSDTLPKNALVDFDVQYCRDLIGKDISADTMSSICESLGMKVLEASDSTLKLEVPAYRVDVQRPCDVVEEILRIYGYNNIEIPAQVKSSLTTKGEVDRSNKLQNLVAEQLVGCGFNEILNNSLTKISYYDGLEAYTSNHLVRLMNPLSQDLGALRQTLLFGGLECISHNVNRRMGDIRFFEYGNCYRYDESRREVLESGEKVDGHTSKKVLAPYSEDYHLGLWLTGKRVNGSWAHADEETSVYELKAYVHNILRRLGVPFGVVVFGEKKNDLFSKAVTISNRGGKLIAEYGVVSKKQTKKLDIESPVYYADINWTNLMKLVRKAETKYAEIPKYPAVSRDLALLLDSNIEFARIEQIAYQSEKKLLKEVTLFDVYEGKNLEAGKKSYAVNFVLQDESKTLNDKQIEAIMTKIEQNICKQLGAKVRGK